MAGHRLKGPAVQCLSCIWSLGAFLGPLITRNFISGTDSTTGQHANFTNASQENLSVHTSYESSSLQFGYAYLTLGVVGIACSLPMWSIVFLHRKQIKPKRPILFSLVSNQNKRTINIYRVLTLILLFFWFVFYIWAETPGTFLAIWSFKGLGWKKETGPLLTSAYFAVHGIGRALGIPLAAHIQPHIMLLLGLLTASGSYAVLLAVGHMNVIAVWVTVGGAALGMSCMWSSMLLWTSNHTGMTGRTSSVLLLGASIGASTGPLFNGFMFQQHSHRWFLYITLGSAVMCTLVFFTLEVLSRFKYKLARTTESSEP